MEKQVLNLGFSKKPDSIDEKKHPSKTNMSGIQKTTGMDLYLL